MTSFFTLLVESVHRAPAAMQGHVLIGPILGQKPEPGQPLTVRLRDEQWMRVIYTGIVEFHRTKDKIRGGILVAGLKDHNEDLLGAVVYPEGTLCRVFMLVTRPRPAKPVSVCFELEAGARAYGFLRPCGQGVEAIVVGGGLPEGTELSAVLTGISTFEGEKLAVGRQSETVPQDLGKRIHQRRHRRLFSFSGVERWAA